ncbi:hypothetical protein BFP97_12820 [Roseivirga sp. 4D4]|uniref:DUF5050 domain-containing protein n=1 Tax=Roseivirga sp. 4D4 TaxID=1889784 RepID=UPI00085395EC|nr:DUF5050 domain-containing protein [Roseivirga sp. 4D4]OEK02349.1 hypothetical protein BFP97_12820 [Roseivirga sp. 4D4]
MKRKNTYLEFISLGFILMITLSLRVNGQSATMVYAAKSGRNVDIWKCDINGRQRVKLTSYSGPDYTPTISPDGKTIAYTTYEYGGHRIALMSTDGSNKRRLLPQSEGYNLDPSWSPDGSEIAYFTNYRGYWQIFKYNLLTKQKTRLSDIGNTSERSPAFSPDGKKIAFQSIRDGNWEIYVMNTDGSNHKRLTNNKFDDFRPSWSPDGSKIVFGSRNNNQMDIYIIKADGSGLKNLTNGKPQVLPGNGESHKDDMSPVFTPDGKLIIWSSGMLGKGVDIYSMKPDGSDLKKFIATQADEGYPAFSK